MNSNYVVFRWCSIGTLWGVLAWGGCVTVDGIESPGSEEQTLSSTAPHDAGCSDQDGNRENPVTEERPSPDKEAAEMGPSVVAGDTLAPPDLPGTLPFPGPAHAPDVSEPVEIPASLPPPNLDVPDALIPSPVCGTAEAELPHKLDLLLVMDNSPSMEASERRVRQDLPNLFERLTSGVRADGSSAPVFDSIHAAVVTTDMGVPGLDFPPSYNCSNFGDDAQFQMPLDTTDQCATGPFLGPNNWLGYSVGDDPRAFGDTLGCIAQIGGGCGYEMQLEAALKSLWPHPSSDIDPATGLPYPSPRVTFLTTAGQPERSTGNGDRADGKGANQGFLRRDSDTMLAIVLVTDEDDCSSQTVRHLQPDHYAAEDKYLQQIVPNLRCYYHRDMDGYLQPINRYASALRKLHGDAPDRVFMMAITGVPPTAVEPGSPALPAAGEIPDYTGVFADARMHERTANTSGIEAVCTATDADGNTIAQPRPATRITQVVQQFGENGVLQSLCADSFKTGFDSFADRLLYRAEHYCTSEPTGSP